MLIFVNYAKKSLKIMKLDIFVKNLKLKLIKINNNVNWENNQI